MIRVRLRVDGRVHDAALHVADDDTLTVTVDGTSFPVEAVRAAPHGARAVAVTIDGRVHIVERLDLEHVRVDDAESSYRVEHVERAGAGATVGAHGLTVRPPMPGRIVRLTVAPGDTIAAGDVIAVLEAMKMQNEVTSPAAGTVARIHVREGDTVDGQAPILELGPPDAEPPADPEKETEVTAP